MFRFEINMYAIYDDLDITATINLGNEEMVQNFFTNIAYHLENKKWGSVYPAIMNEFYKGKLEQNRIDYAIAEIKDIKKKLKEIDITKMVCNMNEELENESNTKDINISLDDIFINDKRKTMTDVILIILKSYRDKKVPLYIGEYYYKELYKPELIDIIKTTQKKQKIKNIIKYIIYLLIVIIIKITVPNELFNEFIKKFIFSMIVAELIIYNSKKKIDNKTKETEQERELILNNGKPKMFVENITLERDLRSSTFDSILDEIDCQKDYDIIIKTLKAKQIKNWQADIKKIHSDLGYDVEYANEFIEKFEENKEQYDTFEYYKINNIYEVLPKEKIEKIYQENDIYRLIKYDNHMNIIIFNNPKK